MARKTTSATFTRTRISEVGVRMRLGTSTLTAPRCSCKCGPERAVVNADGVGPRLLTEIVACRRVQQRPAIKVQSTVLDVVAGGSAGRAGRRRWSLASSAMMVVRGWHDGRHSDRIELEARHDASPGGRDDALECWSGARQGMPKREVPGSDGCRRQLARAQWPGPSAGDDAEGERLRRGPLRHETVRRF